MDRAFAWSQSAWLNTVVCWNDSSNEERADVDGYRTERELVTSFLAAVAVALPAGAVATEFDYRSGRTDVVLATHAGDVYAFEMKLTRWRDALHQAYRNTSFATQSFVVLPRPVAARALEHIDSFVSRGIGLCAVDNNGVTILHAPEARPPVHPRLAERARLHALTSAAPR